MMSGRGGGAKQKGNARKNIETLYSEASFSVLCFIEQENEKKILEYWWTCHKNLASCQIKRFREDQNGEDPDPTSWIDRQVHGETQKVSP